MKKFKFLMILTVISVLQINAQMTEKWKSSYLSSHGNETGIDLKMDSEGNVFVVGKQFNGSDYDVVLIKYNTLGVQQWAQTYDKGGDDIAFGIAIDATNNIYIGCNADISGVNKMTGVMYNSSGVFQWERSYGGIAGSTGNAMDLYGTALHLVGYTHASATNKNIVTVKLTAAGAIDWSQTWDNLKSDIAYDVKVRPLNGDVYLTGETGDAATAIDYDIVTIRYNLSGTLQWAQTYSGTKGYAITFGGVGASFGVYVAGSTTYSAAILKYNESGVLQWNKAVSDGATTEFAGTEIIFNSSNILVAINSTEVGIEDRILKYNAAGTLQWTFLGPHYYYFDKEDAGIMAVNSGYLYLATGNCTKISLTTGVEGEHLDCLEANSIIAGNNGDLIITGYSDGATYEEITTANICVPLSYVSITSPVSMYCTYDTLDLTATGATTYLWSSVYNGLCPLYEAHFNDATAASTWATISTCWDARIMVEGRDLYGCPSTDEINFVVYPQPGVSFDEIQYSGSTEICAGGSVDFSLFHEGSYDMIDWYIDGVFINSTFGLEHFVGTEEGTYQAVVFSVYGCADTTETEVVNFIPQPSVNLGPDITECADLQVELESDITGTYLWSNGETTQSIYVFDGGTYNVTVSVSGCTPATDEILITRTPNPKPYLGPDQSVCSSLGAYLDAGAGFVSYLWNDVNTNRTRTIFNQGTYYVEALNVNGCYNYDTVFIDVIPAPEVTVSADQSICFGSSASIAASNAYILTDNFNFYEDVTSHNYTISGDIHNEGGHICDQDTNIVIGYGPYDVGYVEVTVAVQPGTNVIKLMTIIKWIKGGFADVTIDGIDFLHLPIVAGCTPNELTFTGLSSVTSDGFVVVRFADNSIVHYDGTIYLNSMDVFSYSTTGTGQWTSDPSGYTSSSQSVSVSPTVTTDYIYSYNDGTCSSYDTVTVSVMKANLGPDFNVCSGSTTLDAGSGFSSYLWSTGASTQTINVTTAGTYSVTVTHASCGTTNDAVAVTFNAGTSVNLGSDRTACVGQTITLDAGTASSYLWSTGATSQTINVTTDGLYSVSVTNSSGCQSEDNVIVSFISYPTVELGSNISTCEGESVSLDAGAGYTYLWSNSLTTQTISPTTSGTYSVTITNAGGCSASDNISVTFNTLPSVNLGSDVNSCVGETVSLNAGTASAYLWSTSATTQTINVTTAGTFSVTITDSNGCHNSDNISVVFNSNPTVNLGADVSVCSGTSVTLNAGTASAYSWSTGGSTQTISPPSSGTYSVTITDSNGCEGSDAVLVTFNPNPTVNLGSNVVACTGETITLNAGTASSYLWSTSQTTSTINVTSSGTYSVTVENSFGCEDSDDIDVTFNAVPVVNLGADQVLCEGETVILDAGTTDSYLWSNGATSQTLTIGTTGSFSVTVTDNGCNASDLITVTVNALPVVNLGPDFTSCTGSTITLNAGAGADSYLWSNASTGQTLEVSTVGTYSVTVTTNGCSTTDAVVASFEDNISINLGSDVSSCAGETVSIDAGTGFDTYLWSTGSTEHSITTTTNGTYSVTVTSGSCPSTFDAIAVTFNDLPVIDLEDMTEACVSTTLDAGVGFTDYFWSTTETSQVINVIASGSYSVTVTDGNGCENSAEISVTIFDNPIVNLGSDVDGCGSVILDEGSGSTENTYLWSTGATTPTIEVLTTGTYNIVVTDVHGCTGTDNIIATVFEVFTLESIITNATCGNNDGSATVNVTGGTPGFEYLWSTGEISATAGGLAAGDYTVEVTDANGCTDNLEITISNSNAPVLTMNQSAVLCFSECNGTASAVATGGTVPYTYLWSNSEETAEITGLCAGTYMVTITDDNGCEVLDTVEVTQPENLEASFEITDDLSSTSTLEGAIITTVTGGTEPYSYLWENGETTADISNLEPGYYTVTITDANECTFTEEVYVDGIIDNISGIETTSNIKVFPNPSTDGIFNVATPYEINKVEIFNLMGEKLKVIENFDRIIDLSGFTEGVYMARVFTKEGKMLAHKLVVK